MNLIKRWSFLAAAIVLLSSAARSQTPNEDNASAEPIVAALDSLTFLLHSNGFIRNASFIDKNELDFTAGSDLPEYPGHIIQARMNALGSEVPLEYNNHVKGFIDLYGRRKKDLTAKILALSDYYFPIFEEILDKNDIPLEMKYLAVVESALNPKALSWAGASGPWQFIHSTGLLYGLEINSYVDERRDIYKSTQAACDYFRNSYNIYGDWLLVIASYNCGPGNVNKALRRSGGKTFWDIQAYLPQETRGYVPAFIAVTYIMNYAKEHGISPKDINMCKVVESVEVDNWLSFEQLANVLDILPEQLYDLNPQYKKEVVPAKNSSMVLYLPYEKAMLFAMLKDSIYQAPMYDENGLPYRVDVRMDQVRYKVKKGDNLASIAKRYNVSSGDIKEWNIIRNGRVVPGRYLTIYVERKEIVYLNTNTPAVVQTTPATPPANSCALYYQVKSGDTLYSIARQHNGLTVAKLRELNNLGNGDVIKPGAMLKVQEGS